jgi:D-psicose/D-tagatose/L-ribulose 3-epimerase
MSLSMKLCLFSSTPDMLNFDFVVKVLTGSLEELAHRAREWGYDGIEFMPNPENIPDPHIMETALRMTGALMPVVNTGRMFQQGMALLHPNTEVRRRSIGTYKRMLDFAGHFRARVGLGIARGQETQGFSRQEIDRLADDVFHELAEYAERVHVVIMLEPADPGSIHYINTMDEAMAWVERIRSPAFSVMLDTYQLAQAEPSIEHGIRAARRCADHIHLYDPSRWPPGVLPQKDRLDWPRIARILQQEGFQGSGSVVLAPDSDPQPAARKAATYLRELFDKTSADPGDGDQSV